MNAVSSSEILLPRYQTKWHHMPDNYNLHFASCFSSPYSILERWSTEMKQMSANTHIMHELWHIHSSTVSKFSILRLWDDSNCLLRASSSWPLWFQTWIPQIFQCGFVTDEVYCHECLSLNNMKVRIWTKIQKLNTLHCKCLARQISFWRELGHKWSTYWMRARVSACGKKSFWVPLYNGVYLIFVWLLYS
jgi:hypothetical protein